MEKYTYSNLTADQHKRIIAALKHMEIAAEISLTVAERDAKELKHFVRMLESLSFISPNERKAYEAEIERTMEAAADRAVDILAKRYAAHDSTLAGCILQSRADDGSEA